MNLSGAEQISLGTAVELGWADAFGVPVVVVMEDGGVHDHPMVRDIPVAVVPTVKDGCRAILELLNP
jgi:nucleoside 2-deoxyribosyltransferase